MHRFVAIYRDHVSDRNPVREEFVVTADSRDDALVIARKRAGGRLELVDVVSIEEDRDDGATDRKGEASR